MRGAGIGTNFVAPASRRRFFLRYPDTKATGGTPAPPKPAAHRLSAIGDAQPFPYGHNGVLKIREARN